MRYYFIAFVIYEILISFYFYSQYDSKLSQIHQNKIKMLDHTLESTINTFELSHDDFHSVHSYKMAAIVAKANGATKETRDKIREELLNKFTTFYTSKTLQYLEGMHVFDKGGNSLLRFHKVKKHDDHIEDLRSSLQKMSKNFLYQKGMEVGVYKESYRFQYPLFYDGEYVGSYEYSVSFQALAEEMKKFFATQYVLLLKSCIVDQISAKKAKEKRYKKCDVGEKSYYYQKVLFDSEKKLHTFERVLDTQELHNLLKSGLAGVIDFYEDNQRYDLIVKPIKDIAQKDIGFIIATAKNNYLDDLGKNLLIDFILSSLLSLSIFMFIIKQVKNRNYVRELINTQKDMLVVTDGNGIQDANNAMLEFFGYEKLSDFHKEHYCICEFFIEEDGFLQENMAGKNWIEYILQNKDKDHRVKIKDQKTGSDRVFDLQYKQLKSTNNVFIVFKDITQEYVEYNRLKNRANYDSLTSIYNRGSFEHYLDIEIDKAKKGGNVFSLIMFDIDHFKEINDTHGHDVGDEILKDLTMLISSHIRENDLFARWGGEEFMIISKTGLDKSEILAEKLRKIIEQHQFTKVENLTCSFGVAQYHDEDTKETIVKRADNMLYSAKENGRNSVVSIR